MLNLNNLSVLAYANKFTLWHYATTDKYTTVLEGNYFNNSSLILRKNDLIIVNADTDGEPKTKFVIVTNVDGEFVKVSEYS